MMTVKELSARTGISVRALHYYDEIGLFAPAEKSEAGYRLYDEKDLESLQQILFFRELEIPLKDIATILKNPSLDRNRILRMQREMLLAKKERMERIIASIDDILKGDNKMDFQVFTKTEIEDMFQNMLEHTPSDLRKTAMTEFGGLDQWHEHFVEKISSPETQKKYAKLFELFGGKEAYLAGAWQPVPQEAIERGTRLNAVREKLIRKKGCDLRSFEVKEIVGEYDFVLKLLTQFPDEKELMLAEARSYRDPMVRQVCDLEYGEGAAEFIAQAIEAFYGRQV